MGPAFFTIYGPASPSQPNLFFFLFFLLCKFTRATLTSSLQTANYRRSFALLLFTVADHDVQW
jgi:hypothetical protein